MARFFFLYQKRNEVLNGNIAFSIAHVICRKPRRVGGGVMRRSKQAAFVEWLMAYNGEYKNSSRLRNSNLSIYDEVEAGYNP